MLQMQFTPPPPVGPLPVPPKMSDFMEKPAVQNTPEYLAQLMKDKTSFSMVSSMFVHVERLLDEGKFGETFPVYCRWWDGLSSVTVCVFSRVCPRE